MKKVLTLILCILLIAFTVYAGTIDIDAGDSNDCTDVTYGGTNADTEAGARTNLGLDIGSDVQAWDAFLDDIKDLTDPNDDRLLCWDDSAAAIKFCDVDAELGFSTSPSLRIEDDGVDSEHYAAASIDGEHIANDQIDSQHYAAASIDGEHIANDQIDSQHYAAGSIDSEHIANDQLDSQHYAAASIDAEHLAADIIDETKLADNSIDSEHYNDGSIDSEHLAADIVDGTKIADDSIDSEHYVAGSIDAEHLAADIIDETKIADDGIDSEHYNADSIDNEHINWADLTYLGDEGQPTAAAVGLASGNLDDTDASIEWEDAPALDATGQLNNTADVGDTPFDDLTAGDSYTNYGDASDNTIDELFAAIDSAWDSGKITAVGNCVTGDCFTSSGTSPDSFFFYDGEGNYIQFGISGTTIDSGVSLDHQELSYLDGVSSNIQTQIDALGSGTITAVGNCESGDCLDESGTSPTEIYLYDGEGYHIQFGVSGTTIASGVSIDHQELSYLDTVTSNIQTQLDAKQALHAYLTDIAGLSATTGDMIYFDGSDFVRIAAGNDGDLLHVSTNVPAWTSSVTFSTLTIPNSASPSGTTEAYMYWDSSDDLLEVGDGSALKVVAGTKDCRTYTIPEPDQRTDDIVIKVVMVEAYPNGITITDIALSASSACTDTHTLEHWSDRSGTTQTTIESIAMAGDTYKEDDGTMSDGDVQQDYLVVVNLDDSTDDIDYLEVTICYEIQTN